VIALGTVGVWTPSLSLAGAAETRAAVRGLEQLGFPAVWYPEGPGMKESLSLAAMLLGWSDRIVVASGIANVYGRDAFATAAAARALGEAYPGRYLLGLGLSSPAAVAARGHRAGPPLATMRGYLDALDAAPHRAPLGPVDPPPRVLAALGPRMLELAAARSLGSHTYFVTPEHTAFARGILGPGALLAVEQAFVLDRDPAAARALARTYTSRYLEYDHYRRNLLRFGWPEESLAGGGSDEVVDALVAWGDADAVVARIEAHLAAGADHVCIQPLTATPQLLPLGELRQVREALGPRRMA
jgi:probable F420-dependent oxidoreductase